MPENYVYVAEAFKDGERIEHIIHKNESDALEDILICTAGDEPDEITVNKEGLYLGEDTEWVVAR